MKDPFPCRRRRSNYHPKKVKLVCSFNGTFQPRPPSGHLRYTGGETRIVSVDRNLGFTKLKLKVSELLDMCPNSELCFSLQYKLAVDGNDSPLVLITCDQDVQEMIDDYDELESLGKPTRLWIFVCSDNEYVRNVNSMTRVPSLRRMVLRKYKQSDQIRRSNVDFGLVCEENEVGFTRETDRTMVGLASEHHNLKFEGKPIKEKALDSEIRNTHLQESVNIGINPLNPGSSMWSNKAVRYLSQFFGAVNFQKQPFESNKGLMLKDGDTKYELRSVHVPTLGNSDRENIRPWSCNCSLVKSRVTPFSCSNQHQRSCLYYIRSHRNSLFSEVGTQRNVRMDGRPWVGKFYPGIRSSSDITKQGQAMRLYYPNLLKPSSCASLNSPRFGRDNFAGNDSIGVPKPRLPNPKQCHIRCGDGLRFPLENSPTRSIGEKHEISSHEVRPSWDFKMAPKFGEPVEASPEDFGFIIGTKLQCGDSPKESNGHADFGNLSVHNLSLSSPKEDESPAGSPPSGNLMGNEQSQIRIASNPSQSKAKSEKADEHISEIQSEKVEVTESDKSSKENDIVSGDLAAFYSHLACKELQTIKNSDLEYIKELGSGTYGTVFYGKWKGCDVAIKKLKPSCFTESGPDQDRLVADFWKEAHILGGLHHPHIVALYGVVTDGPVTNLATVTEYMVNGSLKQVLRKKDRTIDRRKRMIIAIDAALGMEYLHEKNIVHFDLKSHNLLVNMRDPQRPVCKIGDLGLSKIKRRTLVSGGVRGTVPWMAPELLSCTKNMVTEKVDVYSFGIVMWELLTGEEPYADMRSEEIIAGIIKGDLRPEVPNWCDPAWRSLMEKCWSSDPESRPSFLEISKELRSMSASMNIK